MRGILYKVASVSSVKNIEKLKMMSHSMDCEAMLFVSHPIILFPTASLIFIAAKLFHQVI